MNWMEWIQDQVNDLLLVLDRIARALERIAAERERVEGEHVEAEQRMAAALEDMNRLAVKAEKRTR